MTRDEASTVLELLLTTDHTLFSETEKEAIRTAVEMLKEQEAKPLRCKKCNYHRDDGWCNEHGREVKESDYCSFGAWEGR